MGKKSRKDRAVVKRFLRKYKTDEFGELKAPGLSKSEARRRAMRRMVVGTITREWEHVLVGLSMAEAHRDLVAQEDAEFVKHIDRALGQMEISPHG